MPSGGIVDQPQGQRAKIELHVLTEHGQAWKSLYDAVQQV